MHLDLRMFRYLHLSKVAYNEHNQNQQKERYAKILILDNKNTQQANIFIYNI